MTERPILFSGPMVRAILDGRKTVTRRVVKPQPEVVAPEDHDEYLRVEVGYGHSGWGLYLGDSEFRRCPCGMPGDRLWVRETWAAQHEFDPCAPSEISRDTARLHFAASEHLGGLRGRPSIHMPRWASRITLEVTGVTVERLQAITEEQARAEGLTPITKDGHLAKWGIPDRDGLPGTDDDGWPWADWEADPRRAYRRLWERINGAGAWERNDWVWCVSFRRVTQ